MYLTRVWDAGVGRRWPSGASLPQPSQEPRGVRDIDQHQLVLRHLGVAERYLLRDVGALDPLCREAVLHEEEAVAHHCDP